MQDNGHHAACHARPAAELKRGRMRRKIVALRDSSWKRIVRGDRPKARAIKAIQQETGADIAVDDRRNGRGQFTIGQKESTVVEGTASRIELILDRRR